MIRLLICVAVSNAAALSSIAFPSSAQTGACCFPCDPCVLLTESECLDQGGDYWGDGTSCNECPDPATVPFPELCTVDPADAMGGAFLCPPMPAPPPAVWHRIQVMGPCGPIIGAAVTILLTSDTPLCGGGLTMSGTTNSSGIALIPLPGMGCRDQVAGSCIIKANGVVIRSYANAKSPDFDGSAGDGSVGLSDLLAFSQEFLEQSPNVCHDYDNDENTGLSDLILFSLPFAQANHCP